MLLAPYDKNYFWNLFFSCKAYAFLLAIKRIDCGFTFVLHIDFTKLLHSITLNETRFFYFFLEGVLSSIITGLLSFLQGYQS
ncbi:MAG: hypothetical protein C0403_16355 [Desulfobacterium sp.]|nr:hypothetical protein [Desulfobacterium sp.]